MTVPHDSPALTTFRPIAEHRIADMETVRVLADPLRFRIVQTMGTRLEEPWTVKRIGQALGEPVTKLYYHIGLLEQHGIVVVTSTRLVSGILEKQYQLVAERFAIDRSLLSPDDPAAGEAFDSILASVLETARSDIRAAIHAGVATLHRSDADDPNTESVLLSHGVDRLSPADAQEFRARIRALCEEFGTRQTEPATPDDAESAARPYGLVVAFYRMVDSGADESDR